METKNENNKVSLEVYQLVNDQIIFLLQKGVIPWKKTWTDAGTPQNLFSGKQYRGINLWLLASLGYDRNFFMTWKQIKELGGTVKKGEQSHFVIFWKWMDQEDEESLETVKKPFLRKYYVFNISQCEGIPPERVPALKEFPNDPIQECESLIASMPKCPAIRNAHGYPFYNSVDDYINMPPMNQFKCSEDYYDTLFHELIHSTGHQSRLNRAEVVEGTLFSSPAYAIEELTAEFGACYLKSFVGFKDKSLDNNAAYIQSWLEKLRSNKNFIVYSSVQAQRAIDFILDLQPPSIKDRIEEAANG